MDNKDSHSLKTEFMNTASIAELYEKQGYTIDALSVYYFLKENDPDGFEYQNRIDRLEEKAVSEKEKKVVNLLHEWFEILIPEEREKVLGKIKENLESKLKE